MTIDYTKPPTNWGAPPPPPPQPPPPVPEKKKAGCGTFALIGCSVLLALMIVFVAGIVWFVFGMIKGTDVYKQAIRRAQSDPRVIAALGSPIEAEWWVTGTMHIDNEKGNADITIPISGPKAKGRIYAEAIRDRNGWRFTRLTVKPETGPEIDLMETSGDRAAVAIRKAPV